MSQQPVVNVALLSHFILLLISEVMASIVFVSTVVACINIFHSGLALVVRLSLLLFCNTCDTVTFRQNNTTFKVSFISYNIPSCFLSKQIFLCPTEMFVHSHMFLLTKPILNKNFLCFQIFANWCASLGVH